MKKLLAVLLMFVLAFTLVACNNSSSMVYAIEAGSAGEAAAIEAGYEINSVDTQAKALMEVQSGTSDAAIIDSLMAGAMVGEGSDYADLMIVPGIELAVEEYAIGFRVGSNMAAAADAVIDELYADGTMAQLAEKYDLSAMLIAE